MARLPQTSLDWLKDTEQKFAMFTGIEGFSYKDFEDQAEKLEEKNPEKGYQLAYENSMCDLFRKLLDAHVDQKENAVSLRMFMHYSNILFDIYIGERNVQKIPVSIETTGGFLNHHMLKKFDKVLHERNPSTICADVYAKFDRGEYTLWNVHKNAIAKKDTIPTKREALELISQEQQLRFRNENRNFLLKLLLFPIHFKELNAIEALTTLACKQGNYFDLLREAKTESSSLRAITDSIHDAVFEMKRQDNSPWFEAEDAKTIDDYVESERKLDAKGIEDKEFNRILDKIGYGAKEAVLDESLDLGNDTVEVGEKQDDGVSLEELLDSDVEFDAPNADAQNVFEKVEFDENEFEMFPKINQISKPETEAPVKDNQISK